MRALDVQVYVLPEALHGGAARVSGACYEMKIGRLLCLPLGPHGNTWVFGGKYVGNRGTPATSISSLDTSLPSSSRWTRLMKAIELCEITNQGQRWARILDCTSSNRQSIQCLHRVPRVAARLRYTFCSLTGGKHAPKLQSSLISMETLSQSMYPTAHGRCTNGSLRCGVLVQVSTVSF